MKRLTISGHACAETMALLIVIAWADGHLDENEKAGVRAAAEVFNLTKEFRARLEAMLEEPIPLDQLVLETLTTRERAFAYVAATWMTGVDEHVDPKEQSVLDQLAVELELSKTTQDELAAVARDLSPADRASHDWASEIVTLFHAIGPRLESATERDTTPVS